jgi:queuine tRNA-ribosyltransferase
MMEEIRDAIEEHRYAEYKANKLEGMMSGQRQPE